MPFVKKVRNLTKTDGYLDKELSLIKLLLAIWQNKICRNQENYQDWSIDRKMRGEGTRQGIINGKLVIENGW